MLHVSERPQTRFNDVIFTDVAETYITDSRLECCFILDPLLHSPGDVDHIGLFQVGWMSPHDWICRVPFTSAVTSSIEGGETLVYKVIFNGLLTTLTMLSSYVFKSVFDLSQRRLRWSPILTS